MTGAQDTNPDAPTAGRVWSEADLAADPHRRADKADRVRRMFAAIARSYDLNNRVHSLWRDQAWRRRAVAEAGVGPADRVLDVACGTGDLTEAFARACPAAVTGLDFTEPMLDLARAKAGRADRARGEPVPEYLLGDAMDLPFAGGTFDVVSIAFGIRNVERPAAALSEFHRVLSPGGRLAVLEFGEPANPLLRRLNRLYCHHVMPVTATLLARDRTGAYRYLPRSIETFLDRATLTGLMASAGFRDVRVRALTFGICMLYVGEKGEG